MFICIDVYSKKNWGALFRYCLRGPLWKNNILFPRGQDEEIQQ